ncbi:MAG TPA: CrcB family protein [Reyranella sp.]|nr:CrcB family protein [Reyranella sp.]
MTFTDFLVAIALVSLGACVGTPLRVFVSSFIAHHLGDVFPWGILVVNVTGCLMMGALIAYVQAHGLAVTRELWLLGAVGFLGSYTTASSFALQTLTLVHARRAHLAVAYVVSSAALGIAAAGVGYVLTLPMMGPH